MRSRAAFSALAAAVFVAIALPGTGGADPASDARELRRADAALAAQSRAAVLGLYALDSQLAEARRALAAVEARLGAVELERRLVARRLQVARHALARSQQSLEDRVRALYQGGEPDAISILLGAESLEAAVTGLDGLQYAAEQDKAILEQVRRARRDLQQLSRRLDSRLEELRALEGRAQAREATLAGARAARAAEIERLAERRRLNAAQIERLETQAAQARTRAATIAAAAGAAPRSAEATAPAAPDPAGAAAGGSTLTVTATGYAIDGATATGIPTGWGVAAVDPSVIPLGTRFTVPGYGVAVAADVGGAVRGATVDLWFPTTAQALAWGRRTVTITLN
jgi:3D (Asp-Asp-Asp) domain-containing protein